MYQKDNGVRYSNNSKGIGYMGDAMFEMETVERFSHGVVSLDYKNGLNGGMTELQSLIKDVRKSYMGAVDLEDEQTKEDQERLLSKLSYIKEHLSKLIQNLNNAGHYTTNGFADDHIQNALSNVDGWQNIRQEILYSLKYQNAMQESLHDEFTGNIEPEAQTKDNTENALYVMNCDYKSYEIRVAEGGVKKLKSIEQSWTPEERLEKTLYHRLNTIPGVECTDYDEQFGDIVYLSVEGEYDNEHTHECVLNMIKDTITDALK